MNPQEENKALNPEIKKLQVGTREIREIKIYPLSVGEQLQLSDEITKGLRNFFEDRPADLDEYEFIGFMVSSIQDNLGEIAKLVLDDGEDFDKLKNEMSMNQMVALCELIYDMNFAVLRKKVQSLLKGITETVSDLGRLSQPSANGMDTDLTTSTGNAGEKEGLQ